MRKPTKTRKTRKTYSRAKSLVKRGARKVKSYLTSKKKRQTKRKK